MGGSDFSTHFYTYDDGDPDPGLRNFKLAREDLKLKVGQITSAKEGRRYFC